ncbi:MAG: radical SAM protein [Deltaproteobacteria bacterium]|nr:radical SAM protein [Deltaproteobacteria bacterium]
MGGTRVPRITFLRIPPYFGILMAHPQEAQLPLSVAGSAAYLLDAGFEVSVVDQWVASRSRRRLLIDVADTRPDLLVVLLDSQNHGVVLEMLDDIRFRDGGRPSLIAMGQYADVFPERLAWPAGPFDACIVGEPEITLVELARRLTEGGEPRGIPGVVWADRVHGVTVRNVERPLIEDLDAMPLPAFGIFDLDSYSKQSSFVPVSHRLRWGWMLSSRGCPFNCRFCSPTLRKSTGMKYRAHSPGYVADAVEEMINVHGCNALAFEDDVFSLSRGRTIGICREFLDRGIDIPWTAETPLGTLDEETIRWMARAGCRGICAGVESGDDEIRDRLKGGSLKRDVLLRNVELLHQNHINLTLYFMIGSPGETREQMERTLDLAVKLKPMIIQLACFTPYPGSVAWDEYLAGRDIEPEMSHYNRYAVNLSAIGRKEVIGFYRHFYRRFYFRPEYIVGYLRHRLKYTLRQNWRREGAFLLRSLIYLAMPASSIRFGSRRFGSRRFGRRKVRGVE